MKKFYTTILSSGVPVSGATVQVKDHYSGANLTLYADNETTTTANPAVSDSNGVASFKCADGIVDLVYAYGAFSQTFVNVQISDGGELILLQNGEAVTINYGKVCYLTNAGTAKLATNAGTEQEARGRFVCLTRGNLAAGATGVFKGPGKVSELSGGTAGASVWLGAAGGLLTTSLDPTNVANLGKFIVPLGEYILATSLNFRPGDPVQI